MIRKLFLFIFLAVNTGLCFAQEYLQIIQKQNIAGSNATFISVGQARNKKQVEANAIKSIFHTLLFQGYEGINDGRPFISQEKPEYTNSFFNSDARYAAYVVLSEPTVKPREIGDMYQGTYRITIRLQALIRDVKVNTGGQKKYGSEDKIGNKLPKPSIIVVPYKKEGESYKSILENDFDRRIAVAEVQKGFEKLDIKTVDLQARLEAVARRSQYEDNAGAADSNDKQLLLSSGADVYVVVDLQKDTHGNSSRVALNLRAYETATGMLWGSQNGWTNRYNTNATDVLCAYAVKENVPEFLKEIEKNYMMPSRVVLQVALGGSSIASLKDLETTDGDALIDVLQDWLDENAFEGDYHLQGVVAESIIFDYVMIPKSDARGRKMNPAKFCRQIQKVLRNGGIQVDYNIDGNNIMLTLSD